MDSAQTFRRGYFVSQLKGSRGFNDLLLLPKGIPADACVYAVAIGAIHIGRPELRQSIAFFA